MSAATILAIMKEKSGLSMYALNKKLGLKSQSHIWLLMKGKRSPNVNTTKSIIKFAEEIGMNVTWDMIHD